MNMNNLFIAINLGATTLRVGTTEKMRAYIKEMSPLARRIFVVNKSGKIIYRFDREVDEIELTQKGIEFIRKSEVNPTEEEKKFIRWAWKNSIYRSEPLPEFSR